jgi:hypothetical protein
MQRARSRLLRWFLTQNARVIVALCAAMSRRFGAKWFLAVKRSLLSSRFLFHRAGEFQQSAEFFARVEQAASFSHVRHMCFFPAPPPGCMDLWGQYPGVVAA